MRINSKDFRVTVWRSGTTHKVADVRKALLRVEEGPVQAFWEYAAFVAKSLVSF